MVEAAGADWDLVYDLSADRELVRLNQEASLRVDGHGFPPDDPALFGTVAWWNAVASGVIETHEVLGTISRVCWSGHGDFPEFAVQAEDGSVAEWERLGDITRYVEGLRVRLRFAVLTRKPNPLFDAVLDRRDEVLLEVWIERSARRNLDMGRTGLRA